MKIRSCKWVVAAMAGLAMVGSSASAGTLRVVEYNVNADTTGDSNGLNTVSASVVETVLQAIGNTHLNGNAQPIDVLALTELAGNASSGSPSTGGLSPTLSTVVTDLNAVYGAGTYAYNTTADPTDNPTGTGNGPSGLVYNTKTIASVTGTVIGGTPTSGTDPRAPMQYLIRPANATPASNFYLYLEHAKAEEGSSEAATRTNESVLVRQSADSLGANANVIYTGDFNLAGSTNLASSTGSAEQAYKNLTAAAGATLYNGSGTAVGTAGAAQAVDPLNPSKTFLNDTASSTNLYTESATDLTARFDMQLVSNSVSTGSAGLQLVPYTQTAFGSSYYNSSGALSTDTSYAGTVYNSASPATNTALSDLASSTTTPEATVYQDLTELTDHLPIVADYDFTSTPEPATLTTVGLAMAVLLSRRSRRQEGSTPAPRAGV